MANENVPATPREKYEALKLQAEKKGRWTPDMDRNVREMLGLPLTDEPKIVKPVSGGAPASMEMTAAQLKAMAKSKGVSTKGSKAELVKRINRL